MNGPSRYPDPRLLHGTRFRIQDVVVNVQGRAIAANLARKRGTLIAATPRLRETPLRTAALREETPMCQPVSLPVMHAPAESGTLRG